MKEAMFYKKLDNKRVKCFLCAHNCTIAEGKRGFCGVRENKSGVLYSLVYNRVISRNIDPIEKKPLFHFYPGSKAFSIATVGCNFRCLHCQNADISQMPQNHNRVIGDEFSPEDIVEDARNFKAESISYTYTEPTVFYELAYDTAKLAHKEGLKNTFVTNGYMLKEPLEYISPYLDAANVDLKFFDDDLYMKVCAAHLGPVLNAIKLMKQLGIWVEVTTLLIPGLNDDDKQLKQIADFIKDLGVDTPWHISAFFPTYKMTDKKTTPVSSIHKARNIGIKKGLRYVYTGNVPHDGGENTYCYNCHKLIIQRPGYQISEYHIKNSRCGYCDAKIDGEGL
jgi:pyruvate formate lyase activating enzyme